MIDNPYQQSHINRNWTREGMNITALDQHRGTGSAQAIYNERSLSPAKDIDDANITINEVQTQRIGSDNMKSGAIDLANERDRSKSGSASSRVAGNDMTAQ